VFSITLKICQLRTTRMTDMLRKHTKHNVLFDNKAINFWFLTTSTHHLEKNVYKRRNILYYRYLRLYKAPDCQRLTVEYTI